MGKIKVAWDGPGNSPGMTFDVPTPTMNCLGHHDCDSCPKPAGVKCNKGPPPKAETTQSLEVNMKQAAKINPPYKERSSIGNMFQFGKEPVEEPKKKSTKEVVDKASEIRNVFISRGMVPPTKDPHTLAVLDNMVKNAAIAEMQEFDDVFFKRYKKAALLEMSVTEIKDRYTKEFDEWKAEKERERQRVMLIGDRK